MVINEFDKMVEGISFLNNSTIIAKNVKERTITN